MGGRNRSIKGGREEGREGRRHRDRGGVILGG